MPRRPKLGQHFLADAHYRRRIAEALDFRADELVIEIGAGRGEMTRLLAERARRVVAIEIDAGLAEKLKKQFAAEPRIEVLCRDVLATDLADICRRHEFDQCFAFGNLPYYITSPILHHLWAFRARLRAVALLVQQEVAERLAAAPGTRAYGYLSVATQLYSQPRRLFNVPPGAFFPPPKVQSSLVDIQMTPGKAGWNFEDESSFLEFVKRCFARKRKNLLNNLAGTFSRPRLEQVLAQLELPPTIRAEQLTLEQLTALFERLR